MALPPLNCPGQTALLISALSMYESVVFMQAQLHIAPVRSVSDLYTDSLVPKIGNYSHVFNLDNQQVTFTQMPFKPRSRLNIHFTVHMVRDALRYAQWRVAHPLALPSPTNECVSVNTHHFPNKIFHHILGNCDANTLAAVSASNSVLWALVKMSFSPIVKRALSIFMALDKMQGFFNCLTESHGIVFSDVALQIQMKAHWNLWGLHIVIFRGNTIAFVGWPHNWGTAHIYGLQDELTPSCWVYLYESENNFTVTPVLSTKSTVRMTILTEHALISPYTDLTEQNKCIMSTALDLLHFQVLGFRTFLDVKDLGCPCQLFCPQKRQVLDSGHGIDVVCWSGLSGCGAIPDVKLNLFKVGLFWTLGILDLPGVCTLAHALVFNHIVPVQMEDHTIFRFYHHGREQWCFLAFGIALETPMGSFVKSTGCTNHPDCIYLTNAERKKLNVFCIDLPIKFHIPQPGEVLLSSAAAASIHNHHFSVKDIPDYDCTELQMVKKKLAWQGLLTNKRELVDPRKIYDWLQPGTLVLMECEMRVLIHRNQIVPVIAADEVQVVLDHHHMNTVINAMNGDFFPPAGPLEEYLLDQINDEVEDSSFECPFQKNAVHDSWHRTCPVRFNERWNWISMIADVALQPEGKTKDAVFPFEDEGLDSRHEALHAI
ncbi:hypothetical protein BDN71DRAFT_1435173 [Pleurotus eryngii]|uniref:Uncharacterized protein n=1 Tax=Pleurotus eryngii TaxID=5323 RepID=A0A9P6DBJ4_PLEER|nr:hypothetical protein BDN71DRAFT_1435173 [Pleurotus eryngii]